MTEFLSELFLNTYFLFDNIAKKLIDDKNKFFEKLYTAFLLPKKHKDKYLNLINHKDVREIVTYSDYAQFCRIKQFFDMTKGGMDLSEEILKVISIKGNALRTITNSDLAESPIATRIKICKLLTDSANSGSIISLCVLGFLRAGGFLGKRRSILGVEHLLQAASWNSIEGILLALYFCKDERELNLNRLYTITSGTLYEDVYDVASAKYKKENVAKTILEVEILKKAFSSKSLKQDVYQERFARLVFSKSLSVKDKEKALFSRRDDKMLEISELPLNLCFRDVAFNESVFDEHPLARIEEFNKISRIIKSFKLRADETYSPLCICADSSYLLKTYNDIICKGFSVAHVEKIDVANLSESDFMLSKSNVFVRNCNEDKQNIFALFINGEISETIFDSVKKFLQTERRKNFRLADPSVTLDLSGILPICFCDKQNARFLKQYCDVISVAPLQESEKKEVFARILKEKCERYEIGNICIDSIARKFLFGCSIDKAEFFMEKVAKLNCNEKTFLVTYEILEDAIKDTLYDKTNYGFGRETI